MVFTTEIWTDIAGWESFYEVSSLGRIRSKRTDHFIIGDVNSAGYRRVLLSSIKHEPKYERFFVHRLVASHFIPNPEGFPEVNHLDGNKANNAVDNLAWTTRQQNELHCKKLGLKPYKPFTVTYTDGYTKVFDTTGIAAREFGVTVRTILNWLQKKSLGFLNHNISTIEYI